MTDRQQQIVPRARKATARKPATRRKSSPSRAKRQLPDVARIARYAGIALIVLVPIFGYYVAVGSTAFALRTVEIDGVSSLPTDRLERIVRNAAGEQLLDVDLDEVRRSLEAERQIRAASVTRVLPDTLRVSIEEREPAVVVRLESGRLLWVDDEAHVLGDFKADDGVVPPPLFGFAEGATEREAAENRDRIARYRGVHESLGAENWDRLDEVDIQMLRDVKVRMAESGVVVRLGDDDYRERLATALSLIEAVRSGDVDLLARYHVTNIERLLASADRINAVDMSRGNGSVTISYLNQDSR